MLDLKKLERKAYTSYYNDGLLEIFLGGATFLMGIALLFDYAYLFGIISILTLTSWAGAKKMVTVPRIGIVMFGPERRERLAREKRFFTIYFTITLIIGIAAFIYFTRSMVTARRIFGAYPLAPIGVLGAIALVFLGYWKQIRRLHLYALIVLAAVFGGPELGIEPPRYMMGLGAVFLVIGIVLLARFLSLYPKPEGGERREGRE